MIEPTITVALIITTPPTLFGILNLIQSRKNARATQEIHLSINSRMDKLLGAEKAVSKAEGVEQGRNEVK